MCSRYWVDRSVDDELERLNIGFHPEKKTGRHDVRPSEVANVICRKHGFGNRIGVSEETWGFPSFDQKLVINARAESVFERKMFRESALHNRIIVPAAGFYEWNPQKEKSSFTGKKDVLFLAGLAETADDAVRYVIITTAANDSVKQVHDRMPLILQENQIEEWIMDDSRTEDMLRLKPAELIRQSDYEQMSLF